MTNENSGGTSSVESTGSALPTEVGQKAREEFHNVVDTAQGDLDAIKQRAADDVSELKHQAKDHIDAAADKAKSFAGDQKNLAADQLSGIAAAVGKVADELNASDQGTIGRYARDLANGLEKMSGTVKDREVDDLVGMAQDFGRTQPVAFLGAAALAGFVASRFALASSHRQQSSVPMPKPFTGDQSNNYQPSTSAAYPVKEGDNVR